MSVYSIGCINKRKKNITLKTWDHYEERSCNTFQKEWGQKHPNWAEIQQWINAVELLLRTDLRRHHQSWLRKNVTIYMCLYFCFWWSLVVCIFYHALSLPFIHNFNASIRACSFEIYSNLKTCTYRTKHWHYHLCAAYTMIFSQAPAFLHSDLPMLSHFSPVHIFLLSL